MKTIIFSGLSAVVLAVGLTGCATTNAVENTGHAVVGTGVAVGKTAVHTVGTGVRVVTSPFTGHRTYVHHRTYHRQQ